MTLRLVINGEFGWFVQQHMRYPLLAAAIVLFIFGLYEVYEATGQEEDESGSARIWVAPRVGWLLIVPFLVLLSVAPTALGAAAADRVDPVIPTETDEVFESIQSASGPVEMSVSEFLNRAIWDESGTLDGVLVRLEGLVVNDEAVPNGFKLTRFTVSCCAADGLPIQVTLRGAPPFEDDTWVVADVVWRVPDQPYQETEGGCIVEADIVDIRVVTDAPKDAYESPY